MNKGIVSLAEYKYKVNGSQAIKYQQEHTYKLPARKIWTKKKYAQAYMEMLTIQANK